MSDAEKIHSLIANHAAFDHNRLLGTTGYSLPDISNMIVMPISTDTVPDLERYGFKLTDKPGSNNVLCFNPKISPVRLQISFNGTSGNCLIVGDNSKLKGSFFFEGNNHIAIIGSGVTGNVAHVTFRGSEAGLFFGENFSGNANYWLEGPGTSIQIGDECMFSWGIYIRTSDGHGIVDMASLKKMNPNESVVIGPHVWLGQDVIVNRGRTIGRGAIVGSRAIVTKDIPAFSAAAGIPAKIVRSGVSWTRRSIPTQQDLNNLIEWPFMRFGEDDLTT